jgi:serine O-acetyltransferase
MISDLNFYYKKLGLGFFLDIGFLSIMLYRMGRWAYLHYRYINPLWYIYILIKLFFQPLSKIELPVTCKIGMHLFLPHPYGLVMAAKTEIGNNCTIGPWVIIGRLAKGKGNPSIKDDVYIGPRATILGEITIGSNAIIGANAFVIKDVPPHKKVYGVISSYAE